MLQKYLDWVNAGRRNIEVKMDTVRRGEFVVRVWCYDFDLAEGCPIELGADPPTREFLRAQRLERLKKEMAEFETVREAVEALAELHGE